MRDDKAAGNKPLSKDKAGKSRQVAKKDFGEASGKASKPLMKPKVTLQKSELTFAAAIPAKFEKGKIYSHPVAGPVRYMGDDELAVAGFGKTSTMIFRDIYAKNPANYKIPAHKASTLPVRSLVTASYMKQVLQDIEKGRAIQPKPKSNNVGRVKEYDDLLKSGDVLKIASVICWSFRSAEIGPNAEFGNTAIHLLAAEYAAIHGMDYANAAKVVEEAAGKPGLAYLQHNFEKSGPPKHPVTDPSP